VAAPVTAPYAPNYAFSTPYITPAEYLAEPTGVDVSQLLPGVASAAAQTAVLTRVIGRASAWADQYCRKILAATSDVQSGEYRVFRDGTIRVPVDNTPLIQVTNVNLGYVAGQLAPLSDLSKCRLSKKVVRIPTAAAAFTLPPLPDTAAAYARYGSVFADVTYVNGYAHAQTATASAAGAMVLQVTGTGLGIVPGLPLTVYDGAANGANTEQVAVASTYQFGSPFVPLAAPALYAHGAGCSVSALPGFVREAVICLTSALIKTRGSDSFVMPAGPGQAEHEEAMMPGAGEDIDIAMELLEPLRRVW
jgi:hypothetical protein